VGCKSAQLHVSELKHVHALQSLTHLEVSNSFAAPMSEFTQSL
jgi:hypothetical protein